MKFQLRVLTAVMTLAGICVAPSVHAMGFGAVRVLSEIGQPLRAEVDLKLGASENVSDFNIVQASAADYDRQGLQPLSPGLGFAVKVGGDKGHATVLVSTARPISDPSISFILQSESGQGRVVRAFNALLTTSAMHSAPVVEAHPVSAVTSAAPAATRASRVASKADMTEVVEGVEATLVYENVIEIGARPGAKSLARVKGAGTGDSLGKVLPQVVPQGWKGFAGDKSINPATTIDWVAGNRFWITVLDEVMGASGLTATVDWSRKEVTFRGLDISAADPAASPATSEERVTQKKSQDKPVSERGAQGPILQAECERKAQAQARAEAQAQARGDRQEHDRLQREADLKEASAEKELERRSQAERAATKVAAEQARADNAAAELLKAQRVALEKRLEREEQARLAAEEGARQAAERKAQQAVALKAAEEDRVVKAAAAKTAAILAATERTQKLEAEARERAEVAQAAKKAKEAMLKAKADAAAAVAAQPVVVEAVRDDAARGQEMDEVRARALAQVRPLAPAPVEPAAKQDLRVADVVIRSESTKVVAPAAPVVASPVQAEAPVDFATLKNLSLFGTAQPEGRIVSSSGFNVSLFTSVQRILPPGWSLFTQDPTLARAENTSWRGAGREWLVVLSETIGVHGVQAIVNAERKEVLLHR